MKPLGELSLGQRVVITFVIVVMALFMLALWGLLTGGWDETPAAPLASSPYDKHLAELDEEALDQAYRNRVVHLFEIWMRDSIDQPRRMLVGVNQARAAYTQAMIEVEKRK